MIVPIFIHIHEKSDKEIREEMERDRRFREAVERDEARKREQERKLKEEKRREEEERLKKLDDEYRAARDKNPWDYQFLPEGWSIFGQTNFQILTEI